MHNIIKILHEKLNIPKAGKQPRKTKFQISIISKLQILVTFIHGKMKLFCFTVIT